MEVFALFQTYKIHSERSSDYKDKCLGQVVYQTMEKFLKGRQKKSIYLAYFILEITEDRVISGICLLPCLWSYVQSKKLPQGLSKLGCPV